MGPRHHLTSSLRNYAQGGRRVKQCKVTGVGGENGAKSQGWEEMW